MSVRRLAAEAAGVACVALTAVVLGLVAWTVIPVAAGWRPTVVLTGSMTPAVLPGDVVVSAPVRPGDVQPGRVLLLQQDERLLVHRAVAVGADGAVTTRGDANAVADPAPFASSAVVGVPRLRIPLVGLPVLWLRTHEWLPLAATVLALTVVVRGAAATTLPVRPRAAHAA